MKLNYILLFCCLIIGEKVVNAEYEVTLEKLETATKDDKVLFFEGLRVKKYNRTTYVINGDYLIKMPLGEDIDMLIEAFNFQGGQYKKMGEKKLDNFCKSLYIEAVRNEYQIFYNASTVKVPFGTCPFPAGGNEVKNILITNNGILPPYIPGGEKWRIDIRYYRGEEVLGGYNIWALVRNQQSLMQGG